MTDQNRQQEEDFDEKLPPEVEGSSEQPQEEEKTQRTKIVATQDEDVFQAMDNLDEQSIVKELQGLAEQQQNVIGLTEPNYDSSINYC